jgi:hypothetical protein
VAKLLAYHRDAVVIEIEVRSRRGILQRRDHVLVDAIGLAEEATDVALEQEIAVLVHQSGDLGDRDAADEDVAEAERLGRGRAGEDQARVDLSRRLELDQSAVVDELPLHLSRVEARLGDARVAVLLPAHAVAAQHDLRSSPAGNALVPSRLA